MRFRLTRDAEEFAATAEAFLAERVERNLLATVLVRARSATGSPPPLFAAGVDGRGRLQAAALRMPPWPLLAWGVGPEDAGDLVDAWLAEDPQVPGVVAPVATARALAAAWKQRSAGGGQTVCRMREALHELDAVDDPARPAPGRLRVAQDADRELLVAWERAFAVEAGVTGAEQAAETVRSRLARGAQRVWDDGGPVSTLVLAPDVAGVRRIGPVYTPPDRRRRGYASSAVAAASREALTAGARRCVLFTDLANPTSNRIYAAVGFRAVDRWEEHAFYGP